MNRFRVAIVPLALALVWPAAMGNNASTNTTAAEVVIDSSHPGPAFNPRDTLGATLDGREAGSVSRIYTRANLKSMLSSGLGAVSLRLRTELAIDAWHWNPHGTWSDPLHHRGYWISSSNPHDVIRSSRGYSLAFRGASGDQANQSSYSRIDDGNTHSCWKSNPYLDPHFTNEVESKHPQWVLVDLGRVRPVNELVINWCTPHASRFHVEQWTGDDPTYPLGAYVDPGIWRRSSPELTGHRGTQSVRTSHHPLYSRWIRLVLDVSSRPSGSGDIRNRLGFAIGELSIGVRTRAGFHDWLKHDASPVQSTVFVSSTDPWHEATALDSGIEEPGFDTVLRSGLTRNAPILVPVSLLYGTPEDAVAELRWLNARHVKIRGLELGEEPDGQMISPSDYGALYAEFARALRTVDPHVPIGGPSFQTSVPDWHYWPDVSGHRSWLRQFFDELAAQHAMANFNFYSFEWYPYVENACAAPAPLLRSQAALFRWLLARQFQNGLPRNIPIYVSELGLSAYASPSEVDLPAAFFDADAIGSALNAGVNVYLYGYEPDGLQQTQGLRCSSGGALALFLQNQHGGVAQPLAAYWAISMLTHDWLQPFANGHQMLPVMVTRSTDTLRIYAVRRPDKAISLLVINEDTQHSVRMTFKDGSRAFTPKDEWLLSSANYVWHENGNGGYARPDAPAIHKTITGGAIEIPAWSMLVLR